jgi:integrase
MANIQRRPDGRWRARYRDEMNREHAKHFDRKVDAQRWLDEVTAAVVTGTYVDPKAGRVNFATWWREWSQRQVWKRGTRLTADQAAGTVTFGAVAMSAIRPSHVEHWIKRQSAAGVQASTIRTRYNYVHAAFRAAVADRIIAADPAAGVRLPRGRKAAAAMTIPTPEQVAAALDAAAWWFRPYVAVCAFAGLRLGEAAGLQLGDVDFLRRTITVQRQIQGENVATTETTEPKFGSERVVYVPDELLATLSEHVARTGVGPSDLLFIGQDGTPLNRSSAGHQWRQVRRAAGLGPFTLHDLRHFYASGLIASGCDVVTVQRALGHSSATITLGVYSHLWPTAEDRTRAAAADLMASVLGRPADSLRTGGPRQAADLRK